MARWLVADTLACPEQWFGSHLSAYSHFLREYGETVDSYCLNLVDVGATLGEGDVVSEVDVVFALDRYDRLARWRSELKPAMGAKFIAQVAAITSPLPWEVRRADGSPAFDLVVSSLPWMVDAARAVGCRAEYMPLAFDLRCRSAVMGVKRERKAIFIGTRSPAHPCRERVLTELEDIVEVVPPVYGRAYFRALASATVLVQPHLSWANGCANSMKLYESAGLQTGVVYDGEMANCPSFGWGDDEHDPQTWRQRVESALRGDDARDRDEGIVLQYHTYECADRVLRLVELARSL